MLARFGGDEFIVVMQGEPVDVADRLRKAVHAPVMVGEHELFVTASIGYSTNHEHGMSPNDLLRDADAAMYRAKARGRDCVEAFEVGGHETGVQALRTAGELRRGVERGEVVPYFQPIVELSSGRVIGYEVLARWLHPDRGLLPPGDFLPLAEETGLLVELGARMLRDSLSQLAQWRGAGHPFAHCSLSVNVGTRQLVDPTFYDMVVDALAETGIDADSLWLEITETALLSDVKSATVALRDLRSLGLHLAVDDFGTGYSSLTYLKRFPIEAIKIDKSFVVRARHRVGGHVDRRSRGAPRPGARVERRGRGHRVAAPALTATRPRLRPRPGLPVRTAPPRQPDRTRTHRRRGLRRRATGSSRSRRRARRRRRSIALGRWRQGRTA